ncbi:DsbA family protein [Roseitranquillus sediminis]|uniref:DsbA family protein n=1 Tax=Roseitranquillus sediminis TaxID=2809051 RepID=UPI001D0CCF77|nr:thioredoxin domain-containing protein [Roseitranquillus sediminis]MBM9595116.1 thioredoxin domain-containing protein [Roseitranquillus sediminis]
MNRKTLLLAVLGVALAAFVGGAWYASAPAPTAAATASPADEQRLVRPYSPLLGPEDASVTLVEFFDPACEACRAFYPVVERIRAEYPEDVRVVLRYTPFHGAGSELAIKVLEAARMQDVFIPVLEALLERQPQWASHDAPAEDSIFEIAGEAGLDVELARQQIMMPDVIAVLNQDRADVEAVGIRQTPTFFVNGKPLPSFGAEQLIELVTSEVEAARTN